MSPFHWTVLAVSCVFPGSTCASLSTDLRDGYGYQEGLRPRALGPPRAQPTGNVVASLMLLQVEVKEQKEFR